METTLTQGITYTYNQSELNKVINNTVNKINNLVIANNYQVTGNIRTYEFDFKKTSKNMMKKIQKYCYWIDRNPSLRRINTLFGILSSEFGVERVKIKVSLKEEKIQNARKAWLKIRNESDRLLAEYKKEKGDFYKNSLITK